MTNKGTLEFANIDNIHVMRQSLVKLHEACRASKIGELDMGGWQNALASSGWLGHVHKVLSAGVKVARYVGVDKQSVVLHCRCVVLGVGGLFFLFYFFQAMVGIGLRNSPP